MTLFTGLDLTIRTGDHTLITGPNGCGKSTLLHMITGDHSKCYANDLRIFGKKRGHGESIWELKKEMGIVSPELHRNHRIPGSALDVVISGLYDSIGLYTMPTTTNKKKPANGSTGLNSPTGQLYLFGDYPLLNSALSSLLGD